MKRISSHLLQCADGAEDFLGKGDHKPAEQTQKALRALACVMALDGHTHLHNAPAEVIAEKMKSDRLLTTVIGSAVVAKAAVVSMVTQTVSILQRQKKSFARLDIVFFIHFPPL